MGTSDQNWSDWKEGLVWTLYRRTRDYLEGGPATVAQIRKNREDLYEKGLQADGQGLRRRNRGALPAHAGALFSDVRLLNRSLVTCAFSAPFWKPTSPAMIRRPMRRLSNGSPGPEQGHSEVWVCGWDRPGLLERIAGAFLSAADQYFERRHLHPRRQSRHRHLPRVQHPADPGHGRARYRPGGNPPMRFPRGRGATTSPRSRTRMRACAPTAFRRRPNCRPRSRSITTRTPTITAGRHPDAGPPGPALRSAARLQRRRREYRTIPHHHGNGCGHGQLLRHRHARARKSSTRSAVKRLAAPAPARRRPYPDLASRHRAP